MTNYKFLYSTLLIIFLFFFNGSVFAQAVRTQTNSNVRTSTAASSSMGFRTGGGGARAGNIGVELGYKQAMDKYQVNYQKWLENKRKMEQQAVANARKKYLDDIKREQDQAKLAKEKLKRKLASRNRKKRVSAKNKKTRKNRSALRPDILKEKKIGYKYELVSVAPDAPKIIDERRLPNNDIDLIESQDSGPQIISKSAGDNKNIFDRTPQPKESKASRVFEISDETQTAQEPTEPIEKEVSDAPVPREIQKENSPKRRTIFSKLKKGLFD